MSRTAKNISMRIVDANGNLITLLPETVSAQILDLITTIRSEIAPVRNTQSALRTANAVHANGRLIIETNTGLIKIGDGSTAYNSLAYINTTATPIRNTKANLTSQNPVPLNGQFAIETDTGYSKMGDGSTAYNSLEYFTNNSGSVTFELES